VAESLGELLIEASSALSSAGFKEPRRQARRLFAATLAVSQADLFGRSDWPVDAAEARRIRGILTRILQHEPLSRILGRREFWGMEFVLSADTLDPRPETETVVDAVLSRKPDRQAPLRFLDLGTGTGCLLLALLSEYPWAAGLGVDIAEGAVRTAVCNAAALGLADRAHFFAADWGAALAGRFDAIVANPPYIASADLPRLPREVIGYDPSRALDGGTDGLAAYRAIAAALPKLLAANGIFATEVGVDQASAVTAITRASGLAWDEIDKDLAGIERCVIARQDGIEIR
jgi:release factor glutamine methyltransferase